MLLMKDMATCDRAACLSKGSLPFAGQEQGNIWARFIVGPLLLVQLLHGGWTNAGYDRYLVDSASSHMLVSKIKPCMSKYKQFIQ
jgi:hypothetical protein